MKNNVSLTLEEIVALLNKNFYNLGGIAAAISEFCTIDNHKYSITQDALLKIKNGSRKRLTKKTRTSLTWFFSEHKNLLNNLLISE